MIGEGQGKIVPEALNDRRSDDRHLLVCERSVSDQSHFDLLGGFLHNLMLDKRSDPPQPPRPQPAETPLPTWPHDDVPAAAEDPGEHRKPPAARAPLTQFGIVADFVA